MFLINKFKKKLHNEKGSSILIALLLFFVCMILSMSILSAAVANRVRIKDEKELNQELLTLESAIGVLNEGLGEIRYYRREIILNDGVQVTDEESFWESEGDNNCPDSWMRLSGKFSGNKLETILCSLMDDQVASENSNVSENPDNPENPDTPVDPESPGTSGDPENPENPVIPENSGDPVNPVVPINPIEVRNSSDNSFCIYIKESEDKVYFRPEVDDKYNLIFYVDVKRENGALDTMYKIVYSPSTELEDYFGDFNTDVIPTGGTGWYESNAVNYKRRELCLLWKKGSYVLQRVVNSE